MSVVQFPHPEPEKPESDSVRAALQAVLGISVDGVASFAGLFDAKIVNEFIDAAFGEMTVGELFAEVSKMSVKDLAHQMLGINGDSDTSSA